MRTLNANERDPRVVNATIRNIQQVVNTTNDGATTLSTPSGSKDISLSDSGGFELTMGGSYATVSGSGIYIANYGNADRGYGPLCWLVYGNAAGGADPGQLIGSLAFDFYDSAGNLVDPGAAVSATVVSDTDGSEAAYLSLDVRSAGAKLTALTLGGAPAASTWGHILNLADTVGAFEIQSTAAGNTGVKSAHYHGSPSPATNDIVGIHYFTGNNSVGEVTVYSYIYGYIKSANDGAEAGGLSLCAQGYASLESGLTVGAATGGDKGLGTVNAVAVYDDNVLLTCYPLEDGPTDVALWDSRSLTGRHDPARKFAARLGTEYDPRTIAGQRRHVRDKKHLTPYVNPDKYTEANRPSTGEWVQRTIEMTELLFRYIGELEDRIAQLEAA